MEETHSRLCSKFCRHCELCTLCPRGVMIPELLYLPMAWELRSHEWFLRSKEGPVKSWENCDQCGLCESRCPHSLPIRDMLRDNVESFADK